MSLKNGHGNRLAYVLIVRGICIHSFDGSTRRCSKEARSRQYTHLPAFFVCACKDYAFTSNLWCFTCNVVF